MAEFTDRLDTSLADRSSILLLASPGDAEDDACIDLLTELGPSATNLLGATVSRSPADRIALWERAIDASSPARAAVVDAGRCARTDADTDVGGEEFPFALDRLAENAEPVDLGMALARRLGAWESTPEPTVICLHSVTALLDRFPREAVISLVDGLNDLCDAVDAVAHHHMDPETHDDETVATFRPLYDAVIERVPENGWTVTRAGDADAPSFRQSTTPPGGSAGTDPDRPETVPIPYSFDQTLDLISVPRRRTLLYHLKDRGSGVVAFADVVDGVVTRERSIPARDAPESRETVRVSLAHAHLPKLDDVGIVEYDSDAGTVRYYENPALESFLRYLETLELG